MTILIGMSWKNARLLGSNIVHLHMLPTVDQSEKQFFFDTAFVKNKTWSFLR
jgi:hypothetical protein